MTYVATLTKVWWFSLVPLVPYDAMPYVFSQGSGSGRGDFDSQIFLQTLDPAKVPMISCPFLSIFFIWDSHVQTQPNHRNCRRKQHRPEERKLHTTPMATGSVLYLFDKSLFCSPSRIKVGEFKYHKMSVSVASVWLLGTLLHQHALVAHWLQASP